MATSLSYAILYLGMYSRVVSVGVALWQWRYLKGGVRLFAILELVGLGITLYSSWVARAGNSTYLSYLSLGIDALFMSLIFGPLMPVLWLRRAVWLFGPLFIAGVLVDYVWWEGPAQLGANYASALECALVSGMLVVYLNHLLQTQPGTLRRHPMAIISGGLLLISLIALPIYLFGPAMMSYSMTLTLRAYDVMFLSAFLAHMSYAYAFWLAKPTNALVEPTAT